MTGIEDLLLRRHLMLGERRRPRHNLERRAGRIFARDRLVIHRMIGIIVQYIPVLCGDAARKEIRIERRTADHRQDLTRLWVHDHRSRRMCMHNGKLCIHRLLCSLLKMLVNRQNEIVARHGGLTTEQLYGTTGYIHLHLIAAVDAAHLLVVDALQAELTDDVARFISLVLAAFEFLLVDFAHIAKNVRCVFPVNIVTDRQHLDHDTRIVILLLLNDRDNVRQYIGFDANWVKSNVRINLLLNLRHRNIDEL